MGELRERTARCPRQNRASAEVERERVRGEGEKRGKDKVAELIQTEIFAVSELRNDVNEWPKVWNQSGRGRGEQRGGTMRKQ